jgi:chromosome segregation ATPase
MDSIQPDDPLQPIEDMEISPEEREQVLTQIETAIAENLTPQGLDLSVLKAEKRGLLFPLLINLAALVLIAVGVLFLLRYFEVRKENITLRNTSYLSAEGTVVQTLKRETESRLQAKEQEIVSIQTKLEEVDRERQALKLELDAELESKEEELHRKLEEELSRERDRLEALGTSETRITDRLRDLESRQQDSIDREIAEYRRKLDAQLQEKETELLESQLQAQEALAQAGRDRDELRSALRRQQNETSAAEQRLAELNARLQAETLLQDQSAAVFAHLQEHLQEQRFADALQDLESLEDNPIVQSYVVDLLKQLVQSSRDRSGVETDQADEEVLRSELAAKTERIEELEEQMRTVVEAASSGQSADALLSEQLQGRLDSQSAQLQASEAQVKRLNAQLRSLKTERDALSVSLQDTRAAQSATFEQGRDDALRDVMTYLRFLSENEENGGDTEQKLRGLTRQDPLFRAAAREIQILIAGGGSSGELAIPFLFLGIVSSVTSERVVIEAMVDLDVSVGSVIQIRRITEQEREITIAEGTVQQVRGSKVTASFKPVASVGQGPRTRDPVYVVLEGE